MGRMSGPQPSELGCRGKLYIHMGFEMVTENQSRCLDIYIDSSNTTRVWGKTPIQLANGGKQTGSNVDPGSLPLADGADVYSAMVRIVSVLV